jgi:molybdate transport system ATP-binding protein
VPVRHRQIGYVPQDLALFPHLSVRQNLAYGCPPRGGGSARFGWEKVLEVLELDSLIERRIQELSGGEKQRVALGRALLSSPRMLLLDEPLGSLDAKLKRKIIPYLARVREEFGLPMLYVTHDRFETVALADEMILLVEGKVAQVGSVQEVFRRPATLAVAGILSVETVQPGEIVKSVEGLATVAVGPITLLATDTNMAPAAREVYACIRAEDVILVKGEDRPSSSRNHLPATVQSLTVEGSLMRVELNCGFPLIALLTKQACEEMALRADDRVIALVKAPNIHLIPR